MRGPQIQKERTVQTCHSHAFPILARTLTHAHTHTTHTRTRTQICGVLVVRVHAGEPSLSLFVEHA